MPKPTTASPNSTINTSTIHIGQLDTPLFKSLNHSHPFFTPRLSATEVAEAIGKVLHSGKSEDIYLPLYANFMWILRGLDTGAADWVREVCCLWGFEGDFEWDVTRIL